MVEALLLALRARDAIDPDEVAIVAGLVDEVAMVPAKRTVLKRGVPLSHSILLIEGMMCRYKDMRNGSRQISAIHVPGDFLDLHGFTLKHLDHDVMALTAAKVAYVPHDRLTRMTEQYPHLTRLFWFLTNLDAAMHREWEVSLGQRSGAARTAHLFCELYTRLALVGKAEPDGFAFPINQTELGECLGMTSVHTNRVLRDLRERGLLDFRRGVAKLLDPEGLKRVAEFDPAYLYLDSRPR
ncbi:Crp/Fnr family transcriptional regulator [Sphingomonas colocasiae]|uniref:Crp/Fnr family transcriptional regulator n=1 Tax=Sphingomonas colocasiae TaxID=1848973 RepID=A0ABS7PQ77_9SPHN|nr:Crp/Fnr family transcriptional regulator [Sphingomonas colocasiae]MBY8823481.1 Crp/Fnr family transcriptional regulator [Sphingomonas colocasiae]